MARRFERSDRGRAYVRNYLNNSTTQLQSRNTHDYPWQRVNVLQGNFWSTGARSVVRDRRGKDLHRPFTSVIPVV